MLIFNPFSWAGQIPKERFSNLLPLPKGKRYGCQSSESQVKSRAGAGDVRDCSHPSVCKLLPTPSHFQYSTHGLLCA